MTAPAALRRSIGVCALLALALVASACSKQTAFKVGQTDINPVSRASLPAGGTLNWPMIGLPNNFNANQADAATQDTGAIVQATMPSVFSFDSSARPVLNTDYVTSATVTATTPHQVVTYRINPKAVWTDGKPISEADFAAQWQALNGTNATYLAASTAGYNQISSVTAGATPTEVVVSFAQPYGNWRGLFSPLYPASLNQTPAAFNGGWITGTAVSAGPFIFKNLDPSAKTITLGRSPSWWGLTPKLVSIVFHAVSEDPGAQLAALKAGTIDFTRIPPELANLKTGQKIPDTQVRTAGGPAFRLLTLNGAGPTLSDQRVRQAVALAINRPAIAKAVLDPLGVPDGDLNNHIYMTNQQGYQDHAGLFAHQDLVKARSLLDQAGWKLVNGIRTRAGQPMSLRMVIPIQGAQGALEAKAVQNALAAAGVPLEIQTVPSDLFFNQYVATGDFDLTIFSWQGTPFPISSNASLYLSPTQANTGKISVGENFSRIGSPAIDDLFALATGTLDQQEAIRLGNLIDIKLWQLAGAVPLYQRPEIVIARSRLANYGAVGFATPNFVNIGFTDS